MEIKTKRSAEERNLIQNQDLETNRKILKALIDGKSPKDLLTEGYTRNKVYKINQRYRVYQGLLNFTSMVEDMILVMSNAEFTRLKVKYKYQE